MHMRFGLILGLVAMAVSPTVLAGPGHGPTLGTPGERSQVTRTIEVTMDDRMRFDPPRLTVSRGETIRFVVRNAGAMKHEMVLGSRQDLKEHAALMVKFPDMEHDDPNAVAVEPGKVGEMIWQFTRQGSYMFGCLVPGHFESGMAGAITVQPAPVQRKSKGG